MNRSRRRLQLESLERRALLSATVVEVEPNDTKAAATAFAFPDDGQVDLSGVSTSSTDKDYFRFTAAAAGDVHVNVTSPNGHLAALEVKTADDDVFETEPHDGVNSGTFHVEAGVTYSLRLKSKDANPAEYLVQLNLDGSGGGGGGGGETPPDQIVVESEPNNKKSSANAFDLIDGGTVQLQGTSQNSDDKDFFKFTPQSSGTVTIHVASPSGVLPAVEVESKLGDAFETEPHDGASDNSFAVSAGVTYFVRVKAEGTPAADYHVNVAFAAGGGAGGGSTVHGDVEPHHNAGGGGADDGPLHHALPRGPASTSPTPLQTPPTGVARTTQPPRVASAPIPVPAIEQAFAAPKTVRSRR